MLPSDPPTAAQRNRSAGRAPSRRWPARSSLRRSVHIHQICSANAVPDLDHMFAL